LNQIMGRATRAKRTRRHRWRDAATMLDLTPIL